MDAGIRRRTLSPILALDEFRPLSASVGVECAARSHRGRVRTHNEDHYLVVELGRTQQVIVTSLPASDVPDRFLEQSYAMVVADGIGGTGAGAIASRIALSTLAHLALHYGRWNMRVDGRMAAEIVDRAEWFYRHVHDAVRRRAARDPELSAMATTMTAVYSAGTDLFTASVGHSRAYIFRDGELTRLTSDDTLPEQQARRRRTGAAVDRGADDLTHILADTIGGASRLTVQVEQYTVQHGDYLLLCTDGLTSTVEEEQIADVLALRRRLDEQCDALIDLALERGGPDNVTVVLAQYRVPQP